MGRTEWGQLTTLDHFSDCAPDVVHDLDALPYPFATESFDEIHAYDVLEHCGRQGDFRFFFAQWSEFWRLLKPDGFFCGICPKADSPWAWGDPSHTRIISPECLTFLSQKSYDQVGRTAMSDFRSIYTADLKLVYAASADEHRHAFVLQAIK